MAEEHRAASRGQSQPRREQAGAQRGQSQPTHRRKPTRRRSTAARVAGAFLYVLLVIGASGVLATVGWVWACDLLGLNKEAASAEIIIDDSTEFSSVVDTLEEKGLIQYKFLFKLYAWFSHAEDKIAPGTYELNTEMDYHALVSSMGSSSSTRKTADVTIKEGLTIDQVFELLDDRGVTSLDKLRDMAANYDYAFDWLRERPLGDYHRLEGYLFPDTYTFELGENPKYVINKMLVNFDAKMDEYMAQYTGEDIQYSLHDIVTIASMIEKETDGTNNDERNDYRSIASVIYNRLERPTDETVGFLNIDASLVYAAGRPITQDDYQTLDSPYNTYLNKGLPPGPIASPGMVSLNSALNPQSTNYYYYAVGDDNLHHYFRTNSEFRNYLATLEHSNG